MRIDAGRAFLLVVVVSIVASVATIGGQQALDTREKEEEHAHTIREVVPVPVYYPVGEHRVVTELKKEVSDENADTTDPESVPDRVRREDRARRLARERAARDSH